LGINGVVKNIGMTGTSIKGKAYVGSVVGDALSGSTINNCYNTGTVSGSGDAVGGIAGENGGTITHCYNTGTINGSGLYVGGIAGKNLYVITQCYNTGAVSGTGYLGGVVGATASGSNTDNCYNTGTVSGSGDVVGGVVGYNYSSITNCYSTGNVSGGASIGGVVGNNFLYTVTNCYNAGSVSGTGSLGGMTGQNSGSLDYSYWNRDIIATGIGNNTGSGGTFNSASKTTAEMKLAAFVTLLNVNKGSNATWVLVSGSYPTFGYSITYYLNGGTNISANVDTYTCGIGFTLSSPIKAGYTFEGWYDNSNFTGTAVTEVSSTTTGDVTLYAKWTANTYNITYNLNDGNNDVANAATYTYGVGLILNNPTKTGCIFEGWYDNASFTGTTVTTISSTTSGNVTLYAKWTTNTNTFTITASAGNNGSITPSGEVSVNTGNSQSYTITANTGYYIKDVLVDGISVGAVIIYNFSNVVATHTIAASFELTTGTAIIQSTDNSINIYPNPVVDKLTVELDDQSLQYQVRIYSLKGDLKYNEFGKNSQFEIDMSNYSTGVYFIQVISPKGTKTTKIIKN
jgi:uncharacterized repeat protein (TIGR02543 family)